MREIISITINEIILFCFHCFFDRHINVASFENSEPQRIWNNNRKFNYKDIKFTLKSFYLLKLYYISFIIEI